MSITKHKYCLQPLVHISKLLNVPCHLYPSRVLLHTSLCILLPSQLRTSRLDSASINIVSNCQVSDQSFFLQGTWIWTADHDLDGDGSSQLNIFSGRGILSESAGPVWMIGAGKYYFMDCIFRYFKLTWTVYVASEHHTLYQLNLVGAKDHYMGTIQSETVRYGFISLFGNAANVNCIAILSANPWTSRSVQKW